MDCSHDQTLTYLTKYKHSSAIDQSVPCDHSITWKLRHHGNKFNILYIVIIMKSIMQNYSTNNAYCSSTIQKSVLHGHTALWYGVITLHINTLQTLLILPTRWMHEILSKSVIQLVNATTNLSFFKSSSSPIGTMARRLPPRPFLRGVLIISIA